MAETLSVTVVQSERNGAYDEFTAALRSSLASDAVNLTIQDTSQPVPANAKELVIAVGMKAASLVAASNAPAILNVLIPRAGHRKLLRDNPKRERSASYSSIFMDQPAERQLGLIAAALPERHRVGLLYEAPADEEVEQLRQKAAEHGLKLYERPVGSNEALFDALQDVLQHSDILLAQPAPSLYNSSTLRNILLSTYRAGIPLVGLSASYVRAGAVTAIFSTPAQFASQASTVIQKFSETGTLAAAQYSRQFEVAINERVSQSMNLDLPAADELLRKISQSKRHTP